jgi:hypothetical protein
MRMTRDERRRAEQLSAAVDQLIHDPGTQPGGLAPGDVELLDTARHLAQLPSLLGPVDRALEQRVMRQVQASAGQTRRGGRLKLGWAGAGLAAILLVTALLTPLGQTAIASVMAVFNLGHTKVRITPVDTSTAPLATTAAQNTALRQSLTLAEAQSRVSFAIPQPTYLPPGYHLDEVVSYTYPDLPAWVPQPFFVELVYEDKGRAFSLRVYPIMLGEDASISGLNLEAVPIQDVRDADINGQPGVLLRLGAEKNGAVWQEVVWEQGELILALSTTDLNEADLLRIAHSVH